MVILTLCNFCFFFLKPENCEIIKRSYDVPPVIIIKFFEKMITFRVCQDPYC